MNKLLLVILFCLLAFPVAFANAGDKLILGYSQEWDNLDPHLFRDI
jgi:hypothetical protein